MHHSYEQRKQTRRRRRTVAPVVLPEPIGRVPAQAASDQHLAAALEQAQGEITTLKEGLDRRTVIGEAIGITMIQAGITVDAAFARLVNLSQATNVKVRDIAQRIVDEANEQAADNHRA